MFYQKMCETNDLIRVLMKKQLFNEEIKHRIIQSFAQKKRQKSTLLKNQHNLKVSVRVDRINRLNCGTKQI